MKIGIVLSNPPGYSETFFTSKIKGLQANGMEVVLFVQNKEDGFNLCKIHKAPKAYPNYPIIQTLLTIKVVFTLLPHLKTVLKFVKLERKENTSFLQIVKKTYLNSHILKHKLDWLHFGFATQALGSELVAKAIGAKMAVSFRGFDMAIYPLKHKECYTLLWKNIDKVHTISDDLLTIAYSLGLPKNTLVQKITPAIDIAVFNSDRKAFNFQKNKIKIISVARLNWKKGFVDVIRALKIVKERGIDFEYTIVGEGIEYERIAFETHELGLSNQVHFLGKKTKEEVVKLYKSSHIFIQYSISEGFCNAVLEAQAMGLLSIVSDAEGLPENIKDKKTGWLVPKSNPQALANKLIEVIHLPKAEKLQISENAKQRVKEYFTIEQQQDKFVEFYKNK
ncbi:MAG: glycosyltransferase [Bacteroidetes bacterium]|nr:MAG: glycosyltransferase [Bacteroidota bacterium]